MRRRVLIPAVLTSLGALVSISPWAVAQEAPGQQPAASVVPVSAPTQMSDTASGAPAAAPEVPAEKLATPVQPEVKPTEQAAPVAPVTSGQAPIAAVPASPPGLVLDMAAAAQKEGAKAGADKRELDAIVSFYTARSGAPLWQSATGRTPAAEALVNEILKAADWGLDPAQFDVGPVAGAPASDASSEQRAADELRITQAALKYARLARGGRVDPSSLTKFIDRKQKDFDPAAVLQQLGAASDAAALLRQQHPQHAQFERLRQRYLEMRAATAQAANVAKVPDGPKIQVGSKHAHVPLVRDRLALAGVKLPVADGDDPLVLDEALSKALKEFQATRGLKPADGAIHSSTRQALNAIAQGNPKKLLANLEQWRWMPDDLGSFYVWVNIPEYTLRVVQDGKVIHTERVIVGKTDTQTPVFSDQMEQVIFHPFWGVPDGIKSNEIQPSLARGNFGVLAKHNLRIAMGNRDVDPASVDWATADLRRFHVYQPPGSDNVLGVVKFRFPNKHDVYMHDTPTKGLFQSSVRTYSHGCMRVQNPVRLAEILLAEDKSMASDRVRALAAPGAQANNQVNLTRKIPVHITYFTAAVDEDGKARYFNDIYGHETRINLALEGKAHLIARVPEPKGPVRAEPVARLSETLPSARNRDWIRNVFTNN